MRASCARLGEVKALDPVEAGRAFGDVLMDLDPFDLDEVEHCFVAKVTGIRPAD